ncbi:MAG: TIGR00269 family protein, partial [Nanoarchaeota archaeon]
RGYDVLATGHNLDDEAQAIMMNIAKGNTSMLMRGGPKSAGREGLVRRVKPLYWLTEKQMKIYSLLVGAVGTFVECPYMHASFRNEIRDILNAYEAGHHGAKKTLVARHLEAIRAKKTADAPIQACSTCGAACSGQVCQACQIAANYF